MISIVDVILSYHVREVYVVSQHIEDIVGRNFTHP